MECLNLFYHEQVRFGQEDDAYMMEVGLTPNDRENKLLCTNYLHTNLGMRR
ncbi:hypothetical protein PITCH_A190032 [uncultured Desulfobacterium sp.]|uniref:Uncharacterized protein n=1 Tax=uncultured Desulfobacterium sp. TaxID=201089 RepID=A0A445MVF2_9BACT|nr:hypothetical protein PITCH_A190032 [uncultured Desulfobacterium sp.]